MLGTSQNHNLETLIQLNRLYFDVHKPLESEK